MPKPPYTNQRRRLEELEEQVPLLLQQIQGIGTFVTYLVHEMGGQVTIPRDRLREVTSRVIVDSDSNPDDEFVILTLVEIPDEPVQD